MKLRILLADDHQIVGEGIRSLIQLKFELVGISENGRALLDAAEQLHPDVIIADISMPPLNGIETLHEIRKTNKEIKVIFLSMHPNATYVVSAFDSGALGYVLEALGANRTERGHKLFPQRKKIITPLLS